MSIFRGIAASWKGMKATYLTNKLFAQSKVNDFNDGILPRIFKHDILVLELCCCCCREKRDKRRGERMVKPGILPRENGPSTHISVHDFMIMHVLDRRQQGSDHTASILRRVGRPCVEVSARAILPPQKENML
jgi:hypothetical protein